MRFCFLLFSPFFSLSLSYFYFLHDFRLALIFVMATTTTMAMTMMTMMMMMICVEQAATKIQAVFRGHKVRASMKQGDSSANSNNTMTPPSATATSDASNDEPTQDELRAEFREDDKGKQMHFTVFQLILFLLCLALALVI